MRYPIARSCCPLFCVFALALVIFGSLPKSTFAQPVEGDNTQIRMLKSRLEALQTLIDDLQSPESKYESLGNSRVKSIGSQRPNRVAPTFDHEPLYIRLYDLSDIFSVSPHYPAIETNEIGNIGPVFAPSGRRMVNQGFGGGGLGGSGGGGVFNMPPTPVSRQEAEMMNLESAQVSLPQLVAAITATVSPGNWGAGEDQAKIQYLGNTLLITANTEMHQQINDLLNLFREHWGKLRTVSIQAYWVRSDPLTIKRLLGERGNEAGAGVIDAAVWSKFLETAQSENRLPYASVLTGHNNQTLNTISGRQKQLQLDATPYRSTTLMRNGTDQVREEDEVEGDSNDTRFKSVVGFNPIRQSFHEGTFFQATPLATRGGNFVILDLHSKVNELIPGDSKNQPTIFAYLPNGEKAEVKLDAAEYVSARLSTTVRCPQEQVVLAGGMNFAVATGNAEGQPENTAAPILYLFVKVTVHTINEDKSDWSVDSSNINLPTPTKEQESVVDDVAPDGE